MKTCFAVDIENSLGQKTTLGFKATSEKDAIQKAKRTGSPKAILGVRRISFTELQTLRENNRNEHPEPVAEPAPKDESKLGYRPFKDLKAVS